MGKGERVSCSRYGQREARRLRTSSSRQRPAAAAPPHCLGDDGVQANRLVLLASPHPNTPPTAQRLAHPRPRRSPGNKEAAVGGRASATRQAQGEAAATCLSAGTESPGPESHGACNWAEVATARGGPPRLPLPRSSTATGARSIPPAEAPLLIASWLRPAAAPAGTPRADSPPTAATHRCPGLCRRRRRPRPHGRRAK